MTNHTGCRASTTQDNKTAKMAFHRLKKCFFLPAVNLIRIILRPPDFFQYGFSLIYPSQKELTFNITKHQQNDEQ